MSSKELDVQAYWDQRLATNLNLRGTGHRAFSLEYNRWLYRAQLDCLEDMLKEHGVEIEGRRVLDVGSGTGFYIEYLHRKGAASIHGVDISKTSVKHLAQTYPGSDFTVCDISATDLSIEGPFDLISAISVLYHIIDQDLFRTALENICHLLTKGGYLLLSDTFRKQLLPTAVHARFRPLARYESILREHGVQVVKIVPLYYFLNRAFVPFLGPRLISAFRLGRWFYKLDDGFRKLGISNGRGMKLMLAQKG